MSIKNQQKPLIILTAGGTGGHVYPAEALAEELEIRGYRLALITDNRGLKNYKGKLSEIKNFAVLSGALVGKSKLFKIKSLVKTSVGVLQSIYLLFKLKPECVVGFGGYASFPACVASILLGTELVIHEQNSVMSKTNRILSKYSTLIAQSFRKVKYTPIGVKTILTGMPIRKNIAEVANSPYPKIEDKMQILILGGSQGAKIFSEVIPQAINLLDKETQKKLKIVQQCRKQDLDNTRLNFLDTECEIILSDFFINMPELYSNTHLIISRSGASSVSEIAVAGIPSILIPLPIAADDHQTSNAEEIADQNAGLIIKQAEFNASKLKNIIVEYLNNYAKLAEMSKNAKKVGINNAAANLADAIEAEILNKRRR